MSEQEWAEPDEKYSFRVWNSEDLHGHRYTPYLSDGSKERWQVPLPRKDFEQLWAAICQQHPDMAEVFGSSQNFIRQIVGHVMEMMLEEADGMPIPPELRMVMIQRQARAAHEARERVREMDSIMKDPANPMQVRVEAGAALMGLEDDVLRNTLRIPVDQNPHELIHAYLDELEAV